LAAANQLKPDVGYRRSGAGDWSSDGNALPIDGLDDWSLNTATRLGEPTVTVRLARWEQGELRPWCETWEASGLRLPAHCTGDPLLSQAEQAALERAQNELPDRGRWSLLWPLRSMAEFEGHCRIKLKSGKEQTYRYSTGRGLFTQ
jgi:CRISPR-associated endonuclease/helicase Cas3